jgi:D-sedoheptulose 7-phosphate isomerase
MTIEPPIGGQATSFLYPFIDAEEHDAARLVAELATSARGKIADSAALRASTLVAAAGAVARAGAAMATRFVAGGRMFTFGNGGSATDADNAVALFRDPPTGRPLPAVSLVEDQAILTALANDIGFDVAFSRQLIAHARAGDIAIGFSTSGNSVNLLTAFEEAARHDILTVGLSGYDGGTMAVSDAVGHCLVVHSDSVHRIQEAQSALVLALWSATQECLLSADASGTVL